MMMLMMIVQQRNEERMNKGFLRTSKVANPELVDTTVKIKNRVSFLRNSFLKQSENCRSQVGRP